MQQLTLTLFMLAITNVCWAVSPIAGSKLFRSPDQISMQLSPDGKYVLTYDVRDEFRVLDLIDPQTGERLPLVKFKKNKPNLHINHYAWVDDDTIFVSLKKMWGFVEIDFSGDKPEGKWKKAKAKGYLIASLPEQDDQLLFAYTREVDREVMLIKTSPQKLIDNNVEGSIIFAKPLDDGLVYSYDEPSRTLLSVSLENEDLKFWYLKPDEKTWHSYLTLDKKINFRPIGFLDDNRLAVLTDQNLSRVSLVAFDIHTQELGEVLYQHSMYDLTSATLNEKGQGVRSISYLDHGVAKIEYQVLDQQKHIEKLNENFNGQNTYILETSRDNNYQIVGTFAADDPGHYYYYDKQKNQVKYLQSEYLDLDELTLTAAQTFTVETTQGVSVEGILTKPAVNANGVLLVFPHGGPVGIRDTALYNPEIQYLASRGYSILNVNFRGSAGFGKEFLESGKGQFGKVIEEDITAVVKQVQAEHNFQRMCSIGASYGGYSAVMLAIYHPQQYECVVSLFGIYDLPLLFNASNYRTLEESRKGIREVVGELDESLKEYSPFYFAEKLNAPILLMAGKEDKTSDFEQANRMKYRLNQLGKDVDFLFYDGVGHGHTSWYGDRHMFAYVDDFIRRKLDLPYASDENGMASHAEDLVAIADAFNFKDSVENDHAKAAKYYQKAAEAGENRAMFNLASYYHRGLEVVKSYPEAISWYQKSSDKGYAGASYRLGKLYHEGLIVAHDDDKSFEYFQIAQQQEHEYSELGIAHAKCLGAGTDKDFPGCIKGLFLTDKTDKEKNALDKDFFDERRNLVTSVSHDHDFNPQELGEFNDLLVDTYNLDTLNVYVDDIEFGLFAATNRKPVTTTRKRSTDPKVTEIPMQHGSVFGAKISFDSNDDMDVKWPRTMVKFKWTTPESIREYSEEYTSIVRLDEDINFRWEINRDYELIEGDWRLQILTMDNKVLFDKLFTTVAKQQTSEQAP
ncbi:prolyl oligopeptidase family serine peptidase [Thalassotalea sp. PS06]|uniref:prolyl oligopeptidase family serine peptidase n=1 Tax=Thalassotalea sp. PS06 TaxID=2594005 RepID=UPI0011658A48|nr:DUF3859 domain-containing protein [Thalassotalea sp. PS06]QDP02561.1 DUF3859 domain-containing protein [Thalassotalea sp. PS06]